jgi:hypothetical protein
MHLDNQSYELVGCDLVMSHATADDLRDPRRNDLGRRGLVLPLCPPCPSSLAVGIELALSSAIIPIGCSLTNENLLIFYRS